MDKETGVIEARPNIRQGGIIYQAGKGRYPISDYGRIMLYRRVQ